MRPAVVRLWFVPHLLLGALIVLLWLFAFAAEAWSWAESAIALH